MKYGKINISHPAAKTLEALEYLSFIGGELSLRQIADATKISQATLLRILNTLIEYGYISKNMDKKYTANFKLSKADTIPAYLEPALDESIGRLVEKTGQSAEIITVKGDQLFWHNKKEAADMQIRLNANIGFRRSIYELDAPSRLYLKSLGTERINKLFKADAFYDIAYKKCTASKAKSIWNAENIDEVIYDRHGNSNGVRRYAGLVNDKNGNFLLLLTVAEAAVPRNNTNEHINKVISAIESEKYILKGVIEK